MCVCEFIILQTVGVYVHVRVSECFYVHVSDHMCYVRTCWCTVNSRYSAKLFVRHYFPVQ